MVLGSLAFVARERDRNNEATVYLREALELAKQSAANDLVSSLESMRRDWQTRWLRLPIADQAPKAALFQLMPTVSPGGGSILSETSRVPSSR